MGSRYLTDLADVCRRTGYNVLELDAWQKRARGSGGFDSGRPNHVMAHHTASGASMDGWGDANYCTFSHQDAPLCNLYLSRVPEIYVCAGGATNTNGSGQDPCGVTPDDSMNSSAIGIEAGNNGTGEQWPLAQQDAYNSLCRVLCNAYGLGIDRIHAHFEWAPTRKIDPAGNSRYASGGASWNMNQFRNDCTGGVPVPEPDEDDMPKAVLITAHNDPNHWVFAWDGFHMNQVSAGAQTSVGANGALYTEPNVNYDMSMNEIQWLIASCWTGGWVPSGYEQPDAPART